MASKVCSDEAELEFMADAYEQAERHILDARGDLSELDGCSLSQNAKQEVVRILAVLFDAAVSVRLLRSNVDGLLDCVLADMTDTDSQM